ncbi:hypothetical protein H1R20_g11381, partial [Candolleomyces eurysporus]
MKKLEIDSGVRQDPDVLQKDKDLEMAPSRSPSPMTEIMEVTEQEDSDFISIGSQPESRKRSRSPSPDYEAPQTKRFKPRSFDDDFEEEELRAELAAHAAKGLIDQPIPTERDEQGRKILPKRWVARIFHHSNEWSFDPWCEWVSVQDSLTEFRKSPHHKGNALRIFPSGTIDVVPRQDFAPNDDVIIPKEYCWVEGQYGFEIHYGDKPRYDCRKNYHWLFLAKHNKQDLVDYESVSDKRDGHSIQGNSERITLKDRAGRMSLEARPASEGQTVYWTRPTREDPVESFNAHTVVYAASYETWHQRFGHPSIDVLKQAFRHTKNFPKDLRIPKDTGVCSGCAEGKMPSATFPSSGTRAKAAFSRIHTDLKQFPIQSYHKYRTKDEALKAFRTFSAWVQTQYSTKIKSVMSDFGGEYKSLAFAKLLGELGIEVMASAPRTPQQNGRAERLNRTIMDKAEAMHHYASIPDSWWEFSVQHAVMGLDESRDAKEQIVS